LAVIKENGFDRKAVEDFEAGPPVLAFGAELAALGEQQVFGREGGILKTSAERGEAKSTRPSARVLEPSAHAQS